MEGFRFLDLSPEIRNNIYFYSGDLVRRHEGHPYSIPGVNSQYPNPTIHASYVPIQTHHVCEKHTFIICPLPFPPPQPSITRTCRQIRSETLSIFYGCNDFAINDEYRRSHDGGIQTPFPKALLNWLDSIRPYVPLMPRLVLTALVEESGDEPEQLPHELVLALTDLDYNFKPNALCGWVDKIW